MQAIVNVKGHKMEIKDVKVDENPWEVSSIFDFSFFCCPECDTKSQNKQDFINHTFTYHLWVSLILKQNSQLNEDALIL